MSDQDFQKLSAEKLSDDEVNQLLHAMMNDLRHHASCILKGTSSDFTIQPTDLVNMAFVKLSGKLGDSEVRDRASLFGVYTKTMKNLLIDHLRKRKSIRHGGATTRMPLDVWTAPLKDANVDELRFLEILDELDTVSFEKLGHNRLTEIVVGRVIGGLTTQEIAAQLNVSETTVENDLRRARTWLKERLEHD